jgi:hypothetical protein
VRLVFYRVPVAAPLEAEIGAESADDFVERRFGNKGLRFLRVGASFENSDIKADPEIVVGEAPAGVGDDLAGFGAALSEEFVLLGESAHGADDFDNDAMAGGFFDDRAGKRPHAGVQRSDIPLAAGIGGFANAGVHRVGGYHLLRLKMGMYLPGKPPGYFHLLMRNTCGKASVAGRIEQGIDHALAQMRRDTLIGCQAIGKR